MSARFNASLAARIVALLRTKQMHKQALCRALDLHYTNVDATVSAMVRAGTVAILGNAAEAGYTDVKSTAPIYGLPGQKLERVEKREREHVGSGVIAGPVLIGRGFSGWPGPRRAR